MKSIATFSAAATLAVTAIAAPAHAEIYKMGGMSPGMSNFVVNATFARIVTKHVPGAKFQVTATGTAVRHALLTAQGKMDFFMASATINWLMVNHIGPYRRLKKGPELEAKIGHILTYQIGAYHYVTFADSGIKKLADIKGRKIFVGPPGGAATRVTIGRIKEVTGLVARKDYDILAFSWDAAIQAFQDRKIEMMVVPTNIPNPSIEQVAITNKIRFLDVPVKVTKLQLALGATVNTIPAKAYGANQVNEGPVRTHGAWVGIAVRLSMPKETVYKMTKAFWTNIKEAHGVAKWMKNTLTLKDAVKHIPGRLHPGAEQYYREIGLKIPDAVVFKPRKKK